MRFLFENGGRSGCDIEALSWALKCYSEDGGKSQLGALLVDFSATNDQPGELLRNTLVLLNDISTAIGRAREAGGWRGPNMRVEVWDKLANLYWAEAEAMVLARIAKPPKQRGRKSKGLRL